MKFSFLRILLVSLLFLLLSNNKFLAQKYIPLDCDSDDWFSFCVEISGNYAIIVSSTEEEIGYNPGGAYLYRNVNGT